MYLTNGVFLSTRTLLHVKNWAPSTFLNFDRFVCLLLFYCYWNDLVELYTTSMYVEYRSEDLSDTDVKTLEKFKFLTSNFEKEDRETLKSKKAIGTLPPRIPIKYLNKE